jgi:hypothetical protein
MPIPSRPIPHPTAVEAESQVALNFVLAEVQRVHPGATIAEHPGEAIEALCVLAGSLLVRCKQLEARLVLRIGDGQAQ